MRYLDTDEVGRMIVASSGDVSRLLVFLVNTGARIGEAVALVWDDASGGQVTLRTRKGSGAVRERRVPLNGTAEAVLDRTQAKPFPWVSSQAAAYGLCEAAKRAGVGDFQPHDLRRTFATRLLEEGVNPRVVADLLGHSGLGMVMRYMQAPDAVKVEAVARLSKG